MTERREMKKGRSKTIAVWTSEQAHRAIPYIASIVRSLRDLQVAISAREVRLQHLQARPGRPDRNLLIEQDDLRKELDSLRRDFKATQAELEDLNVSLVDPAAGLAMIPIAHLDQLAWLVFELFEEPKITSWRYHTDNRERRRPLRDLRNDSLPVSLSV